MTTTTRDVKKAAPASPEPARPTGLRRVSTAGYWFAFLIALGGVVVGLAWGLSAYRGLQEQIDAFSRVETPGEAAVRLDGSVGQVIYYEGPGSVSLQELDVRITDPEGDVVPSDTYESDLRYDAPNGVVGRAIGTFQASTQGVYEVTVGGAALRGARVAVGASIAGSELGRIIGALLLVSTAVAASLVLAIVTSLRRSRR